MTSGFVPVRISREEHADCLERYLAGEEVGIDLLRDCCAVDPVPALADSGHHLYQ